jgi:hypothetical protein
MRASNVPALLQQLSATHPLSAAGGYQRNFVLAAQNVYPAQRIEKNLQERFFIPDDSKFDLDVYLQSAVELSVQNDLKRNPSAQNFEIDKQVNPPKNVEAYYETDGKKISLEVKCPEEKKPDPDSLVIASVGRVPGFFEKAGAMHDIFRNSPLGHKLETDPNKDNRMMDALISANAKFSPKSGQDNLNILFVACGDSSSITHWWHTLEGSHELFTDQSYCPPDKFKLVDIVILSNLKYLHTEARQHHDWTLDNAFILPCINPHRRDSLKEDSIAIGLSVFNHHFFRFYEYRPNDPVLIMFKPGAYCLYQLHELEWLRYFPTLPPKKKNIPGS